MSIPFNMTPIRFLKFNAEMENDLSNKIFNKYFMLKDNRVKISLKNRKCVEGKIVGYFYGDDFDNEPFIVKWQVVEANEGCKTSEDSFGFINGCFILQKDILEVYFYEDGSKFI